MKCCRNFARIQQKYHIISTWVNCKYRPGRASIRLTARASLWVVFPRTQLRSAGIRPFPMTRFIARTVVPAARARYSSFAGGAASPTASGVERPPAPLDAAFAPSPFSSKKCISRYRSNTLFGSKARFSNREDAFSSCESACFMQERSFVS